MEKAVIKKIVNASGVKANELVLIQFWGEDDDIRIMHSFAEAVVSLGASPIEIQQSRTLNAERFAAAEATSFSEKYFDLLSHFDAVLDVFCYPPVVLRAQIGDSQSALYRKYAASLFKALMNARRFTQIRVPTHENAAETRLPADEYIKRMMSAYDVDYSQIHDNGHRLISELSKADTLSLATGHDCRLVFKLTDRAWHLDAGDGDIPCGEVYIAPLECETNGSVYFSKFLAGEWGEYEKVTFAVENGVIVSADNKSLNERIAELDIADKTVCELGFGLNPNVNDLCGYTVLDEKAFGTFHIAIGANTMFGGANQSQHHMDLVGIGTIE